MIYCTRVRSRRYAGAITFRENVMDKKKIKEIIAIVIVGIVSIISSVLACALGIPKDTIDRVIDDVGFVDILDSPIEEVENADGIQQYLLQDKTSLTVESRLSKTD